MEGTLYPHEYRIQKKVKSTFEKDLYKLMNNSVFGKTCEKRVDIKIVGTDGSDKEKEQIKKNNR